MTNLSVFLANVVQAFATPEYIDSLRNDPQILKAQLIDLRNLIDFAGSEFRMKAIEMKKKSDEYFKALRESKRQTLGFLENPKKYTAKVRLAFNTLALSTREFDQDEFQVTHISLLTQIKLKFLESKDITDLNWMQIYRPAERMIFLSSPDGRTQIRIGIQRSNLDIVWSVRDVLYLGKSHPQLNSYYNRELLTFLKEKYKEEVDKYLLSQLEQSFRFTTVLLLYLSLPFSEPPKDHSFCLGREDQKLIFELTPMGKKPQIAIQMEGVRLAVFSFSDKQIKCEVKFQRAALHTVIDLEALTAPILVELSKRLCELARVMAGFTAAHGLKMEGQFSLTFRFGAWEWLSEEDWLCPKIKKLLQREENDQRIGIVYGKEAICRVNSNLRLSFKLSVGALLSNLFERGLPLKCLMHHLLLTDKLLQNNQFDQLKLHSVSEHGEEIVYEFKQSTMITANRIIRSQIFEDKDSDFVLKMKVSLNFSRIKFYGNRSNTAEEQVLSYFFKESWGRYMAGLQEGKQVSWEELIGCMHYLCRHYVFKRIYHHRIYEKVQQSIKFEFL